MLQSVWRHGTRKCWYDKRGGAKSYEQVCSNLARTGANTIREPTDIVRERDCNLTTSHPYTDISKCSHI